MNVPECLLYIQQCYLDYLHSNIFTLWRNKRKFKTAIHLYWGIAKRSGMNYHYSRTLLERVLKEVDPYA